MQENTIKKTKNGRTVSDRPDEKTIYFWNIAGSACNAFVSVLLLAAVTHILEPADSDIFSIAWAIVQLALTVGTFQVRLYQATDVSGKYSFRQYLIFRLITMAAMIGVALCNIFIHHYTGYKAAVILALCVYKAIEALSDVYQGWFQQKERLDLAGKALSIRVILVLIAFVITIKVSGNLLIGCFSMIAVGIICFLLFEIRYLVFGAFDLGEKKEKGFRWLITLFVVCFPLFLNSFLVMSIFNAPKLAIDRAIANGLMKTGEQTIYGIIFMPTSVINLMYIVFRPVITRMAIVWQQKRKDEYLRLMKGVLVKLSLISFAILVGGYLLGIPALTIVYGVDLTEAKMALMLLLLAGGLNTFVNVLDNSLTVIRRQYLLVIAYVITWGFAVIAAPQMVNRFGINGAALSFLLSMVVLLIVVLILFLISIKKAEAELMDE